MGLGLKTSSSVSSEIPCEFHEMLVKVGSYFSCLTSVVAGSIPITSQDFTFTNLYALTDWSSNDHSSQWASKLNFTPLYLNVTVNLMTYRQKLGTVP